MRILTISLSLAILLATSALGVQNAGPTWNQYAESYGFATYPQSPGASFADGYSGDNLEADFSAMLSLVNRALNTHVGGDEDDLMNSTLENWSSGSGT